MDSLDDRESIATIMDQALEVLQEQKIELVGEKKRLRESSNKLLEITKKRRLMGGPSDESKGTSSDEITNQYRVSIYKKLDDLKKQFMQNQAAFAEDVDYDEKDAMQMLKFQVQMHSLLEENNTLKDQLVDLQSLYDRVMAEIQPKNLLNESSVISSNQNQEKDAKVVSASSSTSDSVDKNDSQPSQVNAVDSDEDELEEK